MKNQVPNVLTSLNLLCGCIAITQIAEGLLFNAALLVLLGALFDFADGFSARLLKVQSKIGAELDSLADIVTFGLVPAYLVFSILSRADLPLLMPYMAFSITIFSAIRLAKFNVDTRQSDSFIGLPTPASALLWISLPLMEWQIEHNMSLVNASFIQDLLISPWLIIVLVIIISYLMVAGIRLLSLKFKSSNWKENKNRYFLIFFSISLILFLSFAAIPFILLLYFIFSVIEHISS